jgi:calcineurin-like phosphoesterase family protein
MKLKIKLEAGQNVWFTSDVHYDHKNICSATTQWDTSRRAVREFNSLEEMNSTLVNNINSVVEQDDILFNLGDHSFNGWENIRKFRERVVCKNIYHILGNHDDHIENNKDNVHELFKGVYVGNLEVEINRANQKLIHPSDHIVRLFLNHYPIISWRDMSKGVIHLFGHVHLPHNIKLREGKAMDVGVDGNEYKPYSLREIINTMSYQPITHISIPRDHHAE